MINNASSTEIVVERRRSRGGGEGGGERGSCDLKFQWQEIERREYTCIYIFRVRNTSIVNSKLKMNAVSEIEAKSAPI